MEETKQTSSDEQKSTNTPIDFSKFPRVRNREEARALEKVLRKSGKTKAEMKSIVSLAKTLAKAYDAEGQSNARIFFREGEKVKLNADKIMAHPDWDKKQDAYKDFVLSNIENTFTAKLIDKMQDSPLIVTLAEDTSEQQWWFTQDDLLVLDESDGTFKEMWMIEEPVKTDKE